MGWETRAGRQYYYEKQWVNGTCHSKYLGTGVLADCASRLAELDQQRRHLDRDIFKAHEVEQDQIDQEIDKVCSQVKQVVTAALLTAGYHQHKREWRKKRMARTEAEKDKAFKALKRLQDGKGTKEDEMAFITVLDSAPNAWLAFGDIVDHAIDIAIGAISGKNKLFELGLKRRAEEIKKSYGYAQAGPLEKMLIDHILLCWVRLYWVESLFTQNIQEQMTYKGVQHWEDRLTKSQRRFDKACLTYAKVKRLASRTPEILQVNIAQQQVNQVNP